MLCNLWHIKQTNGLYYYALDYLRAVEPRMRVLVRPALYRSARKALPHHDVRALGVWGLITSLALAALRGNWVFTPTSHPFPLLRRQLIVIHDDYPFLSRRGLLKRRIFHLLLALSRCEVGHINHSTALRAIPAALVPPPRRWYLPNLGPLEEDIDALRRQRAGQSTTTGPSTRRRVALFGTDSRKKRYEVLFGAVRAAGLAERLDFVIYGHATAYLQGLRIEYPEMSIELADSSVVSMEVFLARADCVASVAEHEGFGRPIALALAAGIPCFLLRSPVFEEFFGSSTQLHQSLDALVAALAAAASQAPLFDVSPQGPPSGQFTELPRIRLAFSQAVDRLSRLATEEKHSA